MQAAVEGDRTAKADAGQARGVTYINNLFATTTIHTGLLCCADLPELGARRNVQRIILCLAIRPGIPSRESAQALASDTTVRQVQRSQPPSQSIHIKSSLKTMCWSRGHRWRHDSLPTLRPHKSNLSAERLEAPNSNFRAGSCGCLRSCIVLWS